MMKRVMTMAIAAISLIAVAGAPAFATTAKHTKHKVSCKQIKEALDGGKSSEDVQKDLHVTAERVKSCTSSTAKKTKAPAEKKS
jgi:Tfp pilus assembly protein FimT